MPESIISRLFALPSLILAVAVFNLMPAHSMAIERRPEGCEILTLYFENDFFFGSDELYTNGLKLSWTSADLETYRGKSGFGAWARSLMDEQFSANNPKDSHFVSLSLGQNIYTPEDTESLEVVADDRPYAGLLYLGLGYSKRSLSQVNHWEMVLGLVGPNAHAQQTQAFSHHFFDNDEPRGWSNQIDNEPVLNIYYEQKLRVLRSQSDWGYDLYAYLVSGLGNLYIGALGGFQLRLGWQLPNDFGSGLIRPGPDTNAPLGKDDPRFFRPMRRFSAHIFAGLEGNYVLRNLTLDGNTAGSSHRVEKKPLVGGLALGIGFTIGRFKITMAHIYQTKEFTTQSENSDYGSIALSWIY